MTIFNLMFMTNLLKRHSILGRIVMKYKTSWVLGLISITANP
jgi:hypothetical protein